jgi:hypothetical protein
VDEGYTLLALVISLILFGFFHQDRVAAHLRRARLAGLDRRNDAVGQAQPRCRYADAG